MCEDPERRLPPSEIAGVADVLPLQPKPARNVCVPRGTQITRWRLFLGGGATLLALRALVAVLELMPCRVLRVLGYCPVISRFRMHSTPLGESWKSCCLSLPVVFLPCTRPA